MKAITYTGILSVVLALFSACDVANDLDDFEPLFQLDSEIAIRDESSAELALTGMYAGLRIEGNPDLYLFSTLMGNIARANEFFRFPAPLAYSQNNPLVDDQDAIQAYQGMYRVVNRANWIIEKVAGLDELVFTTPGRRVEIIGEAKAMRALAHFNLLRLWGQFYDVDSEFGINVRTNPSRSSDALPRNTVAGTYAAIVQDLDDAIVSAPDLRAKFFANKTFAKALKAKVLLYQEDYAGAAVLARDVIDNSGPDFELTATYEELFDNDTIDIFSTTEILFGSKGEPEAPTFLDNSWGVVLQVKPAFAELGETGSMVVAGQDIAYDNNRISSQIEDEGEMNGLVCTKFANRDESYDMIYHLRMAEVYLIYAEAAARAANVVTADALEALNAVRERAGATDTGGDGFEIYPAAITLNQFLEAVRIEKSIELWGELGEEWYDLIRYDFIDGFGSGFQISDIVPTATNTDLFILPISTESIAAGGNVVVQNPGY